MEDQFSLFDTSWPKHDDFPLNNNLGNVEKWVQKDISESKKVLILTGFTSLEYIIKTIADKELWDGREIEIVLGNEPLLQSQTLKKSFASYVKKFSDQIAEYWLKEGISLILNGPLLTLIQAVEEQKIKFYYHPKLHGKIYVGDFYLTMGSSNYSDSGMKHQAEINARFDVESYYYKELHTIAHNYRVKSEAYNEELAELLRNLLRFVGWEEALSCAIAELLDGKWVDEYLQNIHPDQKTQLWPTQRQAIGQALYILDNEGSVLVAEPTGSGKTRVGAHLLSALLNRFWQQGRGIRSNYHIITPPIVIPNWEDELANIRFTMASPSSHGMLSQSESENFDALLKKIRNANVLLIDEAHNYLNKTSQRTRTIKSNKADHVILFTATPINKKWNDLLRMVEILGLDNLSESAYRAYKKLNKMRGKTAPDNDVLEQLRTYSQKFIVRRTKNEINEIIDRQPEAFTNKHGEKCRFPKHNCHVYSIKQTQKDVKIAEEIDQLTKKLIGIPFLRDLSLSQFQLREQLNQENYVQGRINSGKALLRYNIRNTLRSSRAAVIEHLLGTREAERWAGVKSYKTESGDIIGSMKEITTVPKAKNVEKEVIPEWMKKWDLYKEKLDHEIEILESIVNLVKQMSSGRERSKAEFLKKMSDEEHHVIAFDSRVITHHIIEKHLKELVSEDTEIMIATGSSKGSNKSDIQKLMNPDSESESVIGLCTDALAEGVNLQKASTVVFLDMPTVIRRAEQRAGRVDRLDSPHKQIHIYWPDDHKAFQLEVDKKFIHRHEMVDAVIGANIEVPSSFYSDKVNKIDAQTLAETYLDRQKEDNEWQGVDDAFKPVRNFIGENKLISPDLYETLKTDESDTKCRLSLVQAEKNWGFFSLRGTQQRAPKWILINENDELIQDIPTICRYLKKVLPGSETHNERNAQSDQTVQKMVNRLNKARLEMLPNRRKLMLKTIRNLIDHWLKEEQKKEEQDRMFIMICEKFENLFHHHFTIERHSIDCYELSQLFFDRMEPYFKDAEEDRQRSRYLSSIRELKNWLRDNPMKKEDLIDIWDHLPLDKPIDKQLTAAIIGV